MTDKLSYDIIGLVALIDQVKRAANRYLRNEERIASTKLISKIITNDIKERLSEPGSVPCDNDSLIIAGGCSGFETLTDLVNPNSLGTVTATLQVQRGGTNALNTNDFFFFFFATSPWGIKVGVVSTYWLGFLLL